MHLELGQIPEGKKIKSVQIHLTYPEFSNLLLSSAQERLEILHWLEQIVIPSLKYQEFGKISLHIHPRIIPNQQFLPKTSEKMVENV